MEEGDPLRHFLLPYIWVPSSPGLFLASLSAILARSPHNHLLPALPPNLSPVSSHCFKTGTQALFSVILSKNPPAARAPPFPSLLCAPFF